MELPQCQTGTRVCRTAGSPRRSAAATTSCSGSGTARTPTRCCRRRASRHLRNDSSILRLELTEVALDPRRALDVGPVALMPYALQMQRIAPDQPEHERERREHEIEEHRNDHARDRPADRER